MNLLGIDIGTTTISAVLLDAKDGKLQNSVTLKNDSFIFSGPAFERAQDVSKILATVKKAVRSITDGKDLACIGVTGQMHGILYTDEKGQPLSPLFTWQDERGNELMKSGVSYASFLTSETGIKAASGFGLTTHFYNLKNGLLPKSYKKLCTIHDYLVSVLTSSPAVTHSSDAASLGFFDLKKLCFSESALEKAGISTDVLPPVTPRTALAGKTKDTFLPDGIPVAVAIGDNQASFIGSVRDMNTNVLVNVGTGSQVSFLTANTAVPPVGEIRPLSESDYLFVGSSLCGGRAYAVLKDFFVQCGALFDVQNDDLYGKMDALSQNIFDLKDPLTVNCEFCGTRDDPNGRGSIENIGLHNFTPENLICGVLCGTAEELFLMYDKATNLLPQAPKGLIGSGNGLRKSAVWREIFSRRFTLPLTLPRHMEEASVGAAVFAAVGSELFPNISEAQKALL